MDVNKRDFHAIHPLKRKSVVIAKCLNRRDAIAILRAKRSLRETNADVRKNLGVTGKICINESLCPEFRRLFGIANAFFKKKMFVSLFTLNGSIRIDVKGDNIQRTIEHISDLIAIFGNEAVENIISEHKSKYIKPCFNYQY